MTVLSLCRACTRGECWNCTGGDCEHSRRSRPGRGLLYAEALVVLVLCVFLAGVILGSLK